MQKTVIAKLVPQEREGWSKGDVLKCVRSTIAVKENQLSIGAANNPDGTSTWFQPQQLLILDPEQPVKEGDWYVFRMDKDELLQCQDDEEANRCNNHPVIKRSSIKIIASHPHIPGTLPVTESFLHEFVANPGAEVRMEMEPCCEVECTNRCKDGTTVLSTDDKGCAALRMKEKTDSELIYEAWDKVKNGEKAIDPVEALRYEHVNSINKSAIDFAKQNYNDCVNRTFKDGLEIGFKAGYAEGVKSGDTSKVTRVEVIAIGKGRDYVNMDAGKATISLQDDRRTLKIFIEKIKNR